MIFVNILTSHSTDSISKILSEIESDVINNKLKPLYRELTYVEYELNGCVGMYAMADTDILNKLVQEYNKMGIMVTYLDISKDILFGTIPVILQKEKQELLNNMAMIYIIENNSVDIILDKINEKGLESLTLKDKEILAGN